MKSLAVLLAVITVLVFYAAPAVCGSNSDILKDGLLGAATGAIASGASGGEAGKGALIGAGVNVVGGALLDSITGQQVGTVNEVQSLPAPDAFQQGYREGYQQGFNQGYQQGYNAGFTKGFEAGANR